MLVHLLRSHPEICAHDEVFSPDKVRGLSGKYLQKSREDPGFWEAKFTVLFAGHRSFSISYEQLISGERSSLISFFASLVYYRAV
jgi:hypothetical protein